MQFPTATTRCLRALRSVLINDGLLPSPSSRQQTRGKKYVVKPRPMVKVKLLEDIKGYGARGSVIPVNPGRMRNIWHPSKKARYMTQAQLEKLGDNFKERDFNFGLAKEESDTADKLQVPERQITPATKLKLLKSDVASDLLSKLLPARISFYRTPLLPQMARKLRSKGSHKGETNQTQTEAAIYGSVTRADMATTLKTVLSEDEQGARIVLGAEDIAIIARQGENFGVEPDRVKALGDFTIEVRVKGAEPIRRVVRVKEQVEGETYR